MDEGTKQPLRRLYGRCVKCEGIRRAMRNDKGEFVCFTCGEAFKIVGDRDEIERLHRQGGEGESLS